MMIDRRVFINFDWTLLVVTILLSGIGLVNLYSASYGYDSGRTSVFLKQFYYMLIGFVLILVILQIDYRKFERYAYWIYMLSLLLLLMVLVAGKTGGGAKRWIGFGGLTYQPSELMKLCIILALAKYFHNTSKGSGFYLRELLVPGLLTALPAILIMKQPDLGTALIVLSLFGSIVLFVRIRLASFFIVLASGASMIPIMWHFLKDYQKKRILTFLDPETDALGSGYHIIQSIIAVGSGKIFGKGYLSGTQSKLQFLPEHHTDFIFSVFAEEWGFAGSMIMIILFLFLIFWCVGIVKECEERFETILAFGITAMISWHFLINTAMVVGLLPVVGVPLPFFSYGGSFMLTLMMGIGLLLNIRMRRYL